jgi:hypothetical protein
MERGVLRPIALGMNGRLSPARLQILAAITSESLQSLAVAGNEGKNTDSDPRTGKQSSR